MGIDIKWVVGGGKLGELVKSSAKERGFTFDFASLEAAYAEYVSLNHEYQRLRSQVNALQEEITKAYVGPATTVGKQAVEEIRAAKLRSKEVALRRKQQLSLVDNLRKQLPNLIDHQPIQIISAPSPLPLNASNTNATITEMASSYARQRLPVFTPLVSVSNTKIFEDNHGRWLKEHQELPRGIAGVDSSHPESFMLSILYASSGAKEASIHRALQVATLEFFGLFADKQQLKWAVVEVEALRKDETKALELTLNGSKAGRLSCTTDFHTREYSIRCGPKKQLQQWKQHAYAILCQWDLSALHVRHSFSFTDLPPLRLAPPDNTAETKLQPPQSIQGIKDLALLDLWLRENSFVSGVLQTPRDFHLQAEISALEIPLPPVQYPHIHRWLNAL